LLKALDEGHFNPQLQLAHYRMASAPKQLSAAADGTVQYGVHVLVEGDKGHFHPQFCSIGALWNGVSAEAASSIRR
jgi:hypothetical protein